MPKKRTSAKNVRQLRAKDISGKWKVAEMPDFEEDYLSETKNPHVSLSVKGVDLNGDYEFALESGELNGEVIYDETEGEGGGKKKRFRILFSFEGYDSEMDETNGYGEATLSEDGKTLTGRMNYHGADRYRFVWRRFR